MGSIRAVALFSCALLVAAVLVPPPAVADRYIGSDPAGDMALQDEDVIAPAPTHKRLDIRRVFVRHTEHVVSIRVVMGALRRPTDEEAFGVRGFVIVNKQAQPSEADAWEYGAWFDAQHRRQGSHMWVTDAQHQEQFGCYGSRDEDLMAIAHYNGNWITITIPRRCLALDYTNLRPRWVRVSVSTVHGLDDTSYTRYFDHHRSQVPDSYATRWAEHFFTPRLYPG